MTIILALLNAFLLAIIGGFHFYWAFGGKVGGNVVLPEIKKDNKIFKPSPIATFIVALVFIAFGILPLIKTGLISYSLPVFIDDYGILGLGVIFCLRGVGDFKYLGVFKTVKGTNFSKYDTKYFSPLAFIMGIFFFLIELL